MDKLVRRYFALTVAVAIGVAAVQAALVLTVAREGVFGTGSRVVAVLALLVPMLLLGISGAMMILRLTSRQLGKVDRVLRMMASGDLSARLSLPVDPETAGVVLSFNRMAEKVETTIEKVRRSDESRRQLLADVTHELNTPLTSVLGYLETLTMEDMPLSPERRQKLTGIAYEEAVNLRALIEDLTTLSRLDAEGLTIERAPVPLGDVVERVVRRLSQMAEQRGVSLRTELEPGVQVMGDAQRLDQVVRNLVENALRHTSAPGSVTVSVRRMLSSVVLEVKDEGTGMPPEALAKIGQRFLRVDKSRARHTGGRGLGLAITVGLVEAHGGRVDFESTMGSGTRVRVTLPGVAPEEAPAEVTEVPDEQLPSEELPAGVGEEVAVERRRKKKKKKRRIERLETEAELAAATEAELEPGTEARFAPGTEAPTEPAAATEVELSAEAEHTPATAPAVSTGGVDRAAGVAEGKVWEERREADVKARSDAGSAGTGRDRKGRSRPGRR